MTSVNTMTRDEWLVARRDLLKKEKTLMRKKDEVSKARRALPWVKIEKEYVFETEDGDKTLDDLFANHS